MTKERIYQAAGALLLIFGILPFQLNPGSIPMLLAGVILLSSPKWPEKWRKRIMPLFIFCVVFAICFLSILGYFAYGREPADSLEEHTVIVLGCKVNGDQPSRMLRRRLDTAAVYLKENEAASCIVSGGQGHNEDYSEAYVMKQYLINAGIKEERIHLEDKSTNTLENLKFSKAVAENRGLADTFVIISDGFHQCRARTIAMKLGLDSYAVSANTDFWVVPCYAVREVLSFIKLIPFYLS